VKLSLVAHACALLSLSLFVTRMHLIALAACDMSYPHVRRRHLGEIKGTGWLHLDGVLQLLVEQASKDKYNHQINELLSRGFKELSPDDQLNTVRTLLRHERLGPQLVNDRQLFDTLTLPQLRELGRTRRYNKVCVRSLVMHAAHVGVSWVFVDDAF